MRYIYVIVMALMASHAISFSQTIQIRGQVKNEEDSACVAVTVSVKGGKFSTLTNEKGEFTIDVPKLPALLIFASVGYETKEVIVRKTDSANIISVKLYPDKTSLAEVVVVGYGVSKKMEVTGSFSSTLEGKVAGVTSRRTRRSKTTASPALERPGTERPSGGKSNVLTAGELSDFKKWKLWEGYSKEEFKTWSNHWEITPVTRFCLQVQNEDRKAMAGEKAWLIDLNNNDTIWHSVTDNTGKAELWANFKDDDSARYSYAIVCGDQTLRNPSVFENGINRITVKKECNQSNTADIAFVVDATGSMGDEIAYLQKELQDVIANVSSRNKGVNLRTGSVFYRDRGDEYVTRSIDFQSDPSSLISFIKNQHDGGGGDFPEAVDEALIVALHQLHWDKNARAKILFLILDAPPHDEAKDNMKKLMLQAAAMGVRIVPVVCSGIDKSTEYLMRSIALATNGSYVFLTDDSGVGDKHIKPTTDNFKVELLNDLLQRVIAEMIYMPSCNDKAKMEAPGEPGNNIVKVTVYPNPSVGKISIKSPEKIKELFITDLAGKVLERISTGAKNETYQADLGNYPSGTYLVSYFTENKGWGVKKVLLIK